MLRVLIGILVYSCASALPVPAFRVSRLSSPHGASSHTVQSSRRALFAPAFCLAAAVPLAASADSIDDALRKDKDLLRQEEFDLGGVLSKIKQILRQEKDDKATIKLKQKAITETTDDERLVALKAEVAALEKKIAEEDSQEEALESEKAKDTAIVNTQLAKVKAKEAIVDERDSESEIASAI
uniref:WHEP-TRS domain-containing protein n=1 Tax=Calcidiscus leptoporus TaxID=127549 RepID=A0A7S0JLA2_9EUKA|mmetsp:Transcript_8258/g.19341  ORF Transcript_8258/g.19341 Transcript_8258/m.19341 type:complete len:183 (+) Transcript_8258:16-564(+)|eukprot:CAMPEP_0119380278 /NCGR_PEP_ID=MMETSP1334-20130426/56225_1 /TAXON_ID=127549 /ORGANISM="Calcidiscus leptoporus, Strain RCC1130" /LENGTH=182 /DNA_ID=CAMNT_0007400037 /DNA_START=16 /DNA_END=564 /DNA_ORIENTATION=-